MIIKRKIAQLISPKKFEIVEEKLKPLKNREMLIRIISCGLCYSEMSTYLGKSAIGMNDDGSYFKDANINFPIMIGHEPVGMIEDVGKEVKEYQVGDYVSGLIKPGFASHIVVDLDKPLAFTKIPSDIIKKKEKIKYCLAEPLTCISNIIRAANPKYGDHVAIIGCGFIGLLCLSGLAKNNFFSMVGIDLVDYRLSLAKEFGATEVINPKKENLLEKVKDITKGHGIDVVIEITGKMSGFTLACDIIRGGGPHALFTNQGRGRILIPSLYAIPESMNAGYQLMFKSPIIHSVHPFYSMNYMEDMEKGIEGYRRGIFPLDRLITHEFNLEEIEKGFEMMQHPDNNYLKGIVVNNN